MSDQTRFFVELPADEYGNRAYTNSHPAVVEAYLTERHGREYLKFVAPREIVGKWSGVERNQYGGWLETTGPARLITKEEREEIIAATLLEAQVTVRL